MNTPENPLLQTDKSMNFLNSSVFANKSTYSWLEYGSYVDEQRRILYIETPKVACSSIKYMLRKFVTSAPLQFNPCMLETKMEMLIHDRGQMPLLPLTAFPEDKINEIISDPGWFRFCVVRHPYDRLFSAWRDKIFITEPGFETYIKNFDNKFVELSDFVDQITKNEDSSNCNHHWRSQVSLLLPDVIRYSKIYDIKNLKSLPSDLMDHFNQFGFYTKLPPLENVNKSWSIHADRFITSDIARKLRQFYSADFDKFGFLERDKIISSPVNCVDFTNEFSDAVFDRNRVIAKHFRSAQDARNEIHRLNDEIHRLNDEMQKALSDKQKIESSQSWRITRPLRSLAAYYRRIIKKGSRPLI